MLTSLIATSSPLFVFTPILTLILLLLWFHLPLYISPNAPLPIFLIILYLSPMTRSNLWSISESGLLVHVDKSTIILIIIIITMLMHSVV